MKAFEPAATLVTALAASVLAILAVVATAGLTVAGAGFGCW